MQQEAEIESQINNQFMLPFFFNLAQLPFLGIEDEALLGPYLATLMDSEGAAQLANEAATAAPCAAAASLILNPTLDSLASALAGAAADNLDLSPWVENLLRFGSAAYDNYSYTNSVGKVLGTPPLTPRN